MEYNLFCKIMNDGKKEPFPEDRMSIFYGRICGSAIKHTQQVEELRREFGNVLERGDVSYDSSLAYWLKAVKKWDTHSRQKNLR